MITAVKNLVIAAFIVICLQMQWQGKTLEERTITWLAHSSFGVEIRNFALGAVKAIGLVAEKGGQTFSRVSGKVTEDIPGHRSLSFGRSKSYYKEQVKNVLPDALDPSSEGDTDSSEE